MEKEFITFYGKKVNLNNSRGDIPFIKSDFRRCQIRFCPGYKEIYTEVYQKEILEWIRMYKRMGNITSANKWIKFIKNMDRISDGNEATDLKRKIPKRHIEDAFIE
jgi:hypothetical protein